MRREGFLMTVLSRLPHHNLTYSFFVRFRQHHRKRGFKTQAETPCNRLGRCQLVHSRCAFQCGDLSLWGGKRHEPGQKRLERSDGAGNN